MPRLVVLLLLLLVVTPGLLVRADARPAVEIQILSFSDWHGQVDPISVAGIGDVGGAAVLSAYWKADRVANPNTLTLTAGDAFGASLPLAAFFEEKPAVLALEAMGVSADTLGNHNFDRGVSHLAEMIELADYPILAANIEDPLGELAGVEPYVLRDVGGVKVAIIGLLNPEAATLVQPGRFGSVSVTDPVEAAQHARADAKREGAVLFILLAHMGVAGLGENGEAVGPLIDLANAVGGFDLVLGDHTDRAYAGVHNEALVVENPSKGRTYSRITLSVDPRNGRVMDTSLERVTPIASAVTPDPAVADILAPYRAALRAELDGGIGIATGIFPRGANIERVREVAIGNLVADAMRETYGTQLALTNGGGLRQPLPSAYFPADTTLRRTSAGYAAGPPYDLVAGDAYAVLPFGNTVVTRTVNGAQVHAALEHAVSAMPSANGRFLQVSGLQYAYDSRLPVGARVVNVALDDGTPILADGTTYTLATNDFVNAGGDGYTMLADGAGVTREVMAAVLLEYIRAQASITPMVEGRITRLG